MNSSDFTYIILTSYEVTNIKGKGVTIFGQRLKFIFKSAQFSLKFTIVTTLLNLV